MLSLIMSGLLISFPTLFAAGEFLVPILGGYGWSREACKGHFIGISKLVLSWTSKNLPIRPLITNCIFPWLTGTLRSLKENGC
uniref:Uncharacterized protein n=1 Tax=Rhizophora mucronata TaxID=61149 RepID=A0A2P2N4G7_RHIMU